MKSNTTISYKRDSKATTAAVTQNAMVDYDGMTSTVTHQYQQEEMSGQESMLKSRSTSALNWNKSIAG